MDKEQEIDWLDIFWGANKRFVDIFSRIFLDHICFWIFVWKIGEGIGEGAMGYKSSFYYRWFTKIGHIFHRL